MEVLFILSNGDSIKMKIDSEETVLNFKEKIEESLKISVARQNLSFEGRNLQDSLTAVNCGLSDASLVVVTLQSPDSPPSDILNLKLIISEFPYPLMIKINTSVSVTKLKHLAFDLGGRSCPINHISLYVVGIGELDGNRIIAEYPIIDESELIVHASDPALEESSEPLVISSSDLGVFLDFAASMDIERIVEEYNDLVTAEGDANETMLLLPTIPPPPIAARDKLAMEVLFILSNGDSIKMKIDSEETVLNFKEKIEESLKISVAQQNLSFEGRNLQDSLTAVNCGLSDASLVVVTLQSPDSPPSDILNLKLIISEFPYPLMIKIITSVSVTKLKHLAFDLGGRSCPINHISLYVVGIGELVGNRIIAEYPIIDESELIVHASDPALEESAEPLVISPSDVGLFLDFMIGMDIERIVEEYNDLVTAEGDANETMVLLPTTPPPTTPPLLAARDKLSRKRTRASTIKLKLTLLTGLEVEVEGFDKVETLRRKLEHLQLKIQFNLPSSYIFVHNKKEMNEKKSFNWHQLCNGDLIEVVESRNES